MPASARLSSKPTIARKEFLLGAAVIVAMTILAYLPAMSAGFIWDDPDYVTGNPTLRSLGGLRDMWVHPLSLPQYYPVVHTTFWIEYHLWQDNATGYHLVNILLHAASAVLVWRVLRQLKIPGAWIAGAIFAVHPVHVESVAWVTERKNVLSGLFYLSALRAYLKWDDDAGGRPSMRGYGIALGLFLLALLSKTVTCSLPAAIALITYWKRGRLKARDLIMLAPFFIVGLSLAIVTAALERQHVGASGAEFAFSPIDRLCIAGRAIWFYLGKILWPNPLAFIYPKWRLQPWQLVFGAMTLSALAGLWILRHRITRGPIVAGLFFVGTLLPALGFINVYPMRYSFVADHFQYLASLGPIVLISAVLHRYLLASYRRVVVTILLVALGVVAHLQAMNYKDLLTLWTDTCRKNPDSWMVHTNLGKELADLGREVDAMTEHQRALSLAPELPETHWSVGIGYAKRKDYDSALSEYAKTLAIEPRFFQAYFSIGNVYLEQGDVETALKNYQRALEVEPTYAEPHYNMGHIFETQGDDERAMFEYRTAATLRPNYAEAHFNLGNLLRKHGLQDEAIHHYRQAIEANPKYAEARTNLGAALLETGNVDEAIEQLTRAVEIKPNLEAARKGLEIAKSKRGR